MKIFTYDTFTTVTTIEETLEHMKNLSLELAGTSLENLIAFNHTYYIITKNVYKKLGTGIFTDDELMRKTDVVFGNYYFKALKAYTEGKPCAPAWHVLFDACVKNNHYQFIYMAMGVNAHVNNDLPQTLVDVMEGSLEKEDYMKINAIIASSLEEVITSLKEKNRVLNKSQDLLLPLYALFLNSLIKNWRNNAWDCYEHLLAKNYTVNNVETIAEVVARRLANLRSLHSFILQLSKFYF